MPSCYGRPFQLDLNNANACSDSSCFTSGFLSFPNNLGYENFYDLNLAMAIDFDQGTTSIVWYDGNFVTDPMYEWSNWEIEEEMDNSGNVQVHYSPTVKGEKFDVIKTNIATIQFGRQGQEDLWVVALVVVVGGLGFRGGRRDEFDRFWGD